MFLFLDVEAVAFGVPLYNVLGYYRRWKDFNYSEPAWCFKLQTRGSAFDSVNNYTGSKGAIVSNSFGKIKQGDILWQISSRNVCADLDRFGLINDSARPSKIQIDNQTFILSLTPGETILRIWRNGKLLDILQSPCQKVESAPKRWNEYVAPDFIVFGGMVLQELNSLILAAPDEIPNQSMLHIAQSIHSAKTVVCISFVSPSSSTAQERLVQPYEILTHVGRSAVRNMDHARSLLESVAARYFSNDQDYLRLTIQNRQVWFDLEILEEDETEHCTDNAVPEGLLTKPR